MFEIVILSGKGGTGKTSVTAAFAALAAPVTLADCDVDASDLHIVATPVTSDERPFHAGWKAAIRSDLCRRCGRCAGACRFDAISRGSDRSWRIDPFACEGCGVCAWVCPVGAIEMAEPQCGVWRRSKTRFGTMLHAQLAIGADNSGKLVTLLRREAREVAEVEGGLLLTDGPPGIGCAAIATLSGADHVLFVAEPTTSGIHDLRRAAWLAVRSGVPGSVLINKADISPDLSRQIADFARDNGFRLVGEVPFDPAFTLAQLAGRSIVEMADSRGAEAIRAAWTRLQHAALAESVPRPLRVVAQALPTEGAS